MVSEAQQSLRIRPERSNLRRDLGRLDTVCLLIAAVVVIDTLGAVANGGPQSLTWLLVISLTFFVPAGLVISELGSAFPQEGGSYVWTRSGVRTRLRCPDSLPLLDRVPDLAGRIPHHYRPDRVRRVLRAARGRLALSLRARLHLDRDSRGDRPDLEGEARCGERRGGAGPPPHLFHRDRGPVRARARRPRFRPRPLLAHLGRVHRRRSRSLLQPHRLRASVRGGRRDAQPSAGRPCLHRPGGSAHACALHRAHRRDPCGRAFRTDHEPDRLHRRDEERLHGVRRSRVSRRNGRAVRGGADSRSPRGGRLHLGPACERAHLGSRHGPSPGGRMPRRRRPTQPGSLLPSSRHPGADVPRLGWHRNGDDGRRLRGFREQRRAVLQRRPLALDRAPCRLEPRGVPGARQAAPLTSGRRAAVPSARRCRRRLAVQHPRYSLGRFRDPGRALARAGHTQS